MSFIFVFEKKIIWTLKGIFLFTLLPLLYVMQLLIKVSFQKNFNWIIKISTFLRRKVNKDTNSFNMFPFRN